LAVGVNLMQGAVANNVPGIDGDCGGACACATCHIFVDPAWVGRLGPRNAMEDSMLELAEGVKETSRLACQIKAAEALEGLVVRLPAAQH
jgi:2Fe-2S ferredoxin